MQLKEYAYFGERKRYRLIRRLDSGGFSEVWLAHDTRANNMEVALKIYVSAGGLDDNGVEMFCREFSLLFNMNHGNLLKPNYFDDYQNCPYLAMPYCKNGSVQKLIGKMNENDAWRFLLDIASGLDYLHNLDPPVIHQDISTENILINDEGDFLITDFGISAKMRNTLHKDTINQQHLQGSGKMDFMAPELFSEKNVTVKASDIWALGVTLYELLEGRLPFPKQLGGLAQKGGADIPKISGNYTKELKNIVYQMLAKDPWDRPTAESIAKYILYMISPPLLPPPPPKPRKWWTIASMVLITLLLCVIGYLTLKNKIFQQEKDDDSSIILQLDSLLSKYESEDFALRLKTWSQFDSLEIENLYAQIMRDYWKNVYKNKIDKVKIKVNAEKSRSLSNESKANESKADKNVKNKQQEQQLPLPKINDIKIIRKDDDEKFITKISFNVIDTTCCSWDMYAIIHAYFKTNFPDYTINIEEKDIRVQNSDKFKIIKSSNPTKDNCRVVKQKNTVLVVLCYPIKVQE